jgi:cation:H+ antiporter
VRGATRLAAAFGVSQLVIGLTVVAFGTGSPELAVAIRAAISGEPDIAIGNVVGSNIFNVLFILGLSALIVPLFVHAQLVRIDVPIMIGVTAILYLMAADGSIGRIEGLALFVGIVAYTHILVRSSRRQKPPALETGSAELRAKRREWLAALALVIVGLAMLALGARWLVNGAVAIARILGVSELVIGLTIIAIGTSLPEIATSVLAGLRGQRDIAVGNVVGSNIYNIMLVLGLAAVVTPGGLAVAREAIEFDIPVMLAVAAACFPIFFAGQRVTRWQGALFLGYWVAYTAYLVLLSTGNQALPGFGTAMIYFVIPLTGIGMGAMVIQEIIKRRK